MVPSAVRSIQKVEFRSDLFSTFVAHLLFFFCAGMVWEWVRDGADGRKNASGQDCGQRIEKCLLVICVHCEKDVDTDFSKRVL